MQQRRPCRPHRPQHDVAGANQRLLVGQGDNGSPADRGQRCGEAGGSGYCCHGPIGGQRGSLYHGFRAGGGIDAGTRKRLAQRGIAAWVGNHRAGGVKGDGLLGQQFGVAAGDQGADIEPLGVRSQQLDGLRADTTGAAEDGDAARGRSHCQSTTPRPRVNANSAAIGAAASTPSSRSNRPPWPGMRCPESFTCRRRFT